MFDIPIENKSKPALDMGSMLGGSPPMQQPQMQQAPQQQQQYQQPQQQQQYQQPQQPQQQQQYQQQQQQQQYQQPQQQPQYQQPSMQGRPASTGVSLAKGQKVSLTKIEPQLNTLLVGLGWDVSQAPNGIPYDLDSEAFLLNENGKIVGDEWFVFYNQASSPDGSVTHKGDNRTGAGTGDDEVMEVSLRSVNPMVKKIVFVVTINKALERGHNFGGVANAYIRIVNKENNNELVRFNLTEYYTNVTSMMVGELYFHNNEWKFNPVGNGVAEDLMGLCSMYGVNVG